MQSDVHPGSVLLLLCICLESKLLSPGITWGGKQVGCHCCYPDQDFALALSSVLKIEQSVAFYLFSCFVEIENQAGNMVGSPFCLPVCAV